jgi:flagellar biosynthesis protein FliR
MNGGYLLLVGISFGILLILSQRIVPRHKRMFRGFIVTMAIFLMIRYEYHLETLLGYVLAIFLSFLFWLLIGRYNPVNDKDEIKVYGLND